MRGATPLREPEPLLLRISIHAPHAGRDGCNMTVHRDYAVFQSTRPMRGATLVAVLGHGRLNISIHAPHAGRDYEAGLGDDALDISIHAPHAGRDA